MTKSIVLCADDYGQAPSISEAIIELIREGRLTATSCLVNYDFWPLHAGWLAFFNEKVDIGLHFNLTEGEAISPDFVKVYGSRFFSLKELLQKSASKQLNAGAIRAELIAQLECFCEVMGFLPDFIDGHQHIHQFPIIRNVLVEVYKERFLDKKPYLRLIKPHFSWFNMRHNLKSMVIYLSGTYAFQQMLKKNNLLYNTSFTGIYPFDDKKPYCEWFRQFLKQAKNHGLIMCHPGFASDSSADSIHKARQAEFDYLKSNQFLDDCKSEKIILRRF